MSEVATELMLCGDVMLGRGLDQILPHPGDPALYEDYLHSALDYVELAEQANGPIPRRASFSYVWGEALAVLARRRPDLRIVNLETAVTRRGRPEPKGINYRMEPANVPALKAAGVDCCLLANNHVLDWGEEGLLDTLEALAAAGLKTAGAGRDATRAASPAVLPLAGGRRVTVRAFACPSIGVPRHWAAANARPGVNLLAELSDAAVEDIAGQVAATAQAGDIAVFSVHWGGNWGYGIADEQRRFAHRLIEEAGIDVVHGHSSHHPRAIELYRGQPILYGCGDFLNDYEGIRGYESYRGDLVVLYLVGLGADGRLARLELVPFRLRRFRLEQPVDSEVEWLCRVLDRECRPFGNGVVRQGALLRLLWPAETF